MKKIYVGLGLDALVDDDDYEYLKMFDWRIPRITSPNRSKHPYRYDSVTERLVYMHTHIMGEQKDKIMDHIDGNPLNNQKSNLRFCTPRENSWNKSNKSYKYKGRLRGVYETLDGRYSVNGHKDGIKFNIGVFDTREEAINAHNEYLRSIHGDFAFIATYSIKDTLMKHNHVIVDNLMEIEYYNKCIKALYDEINRLIMDAPEYHDIINNNEIPKLGQQ